MSTVPQFPNFQPVGLEHQAEINNFVNQFPSYSDYNFTSLYSWNTDNDMSASWLHGNLALECRDYTSDNTFYSFMGTTAVEKTARALLKHAADKGYDDALQLVPEVTAQQLELGQSFRIAEDPDSHDYLLSAQALASLQGNRHSHTRELVNRFRRDYGEHARFRELDIADPALVDQLTTVFNLREGMKQANDSSKEFAALKRSLKPEAFPSVRIFSLFVHDAVQAFITYEQLDAKTGIAHFCKANTAIKGIYQYLIHSMGQTVHQEGTEVINIEQDLGIPGLRASKQYLRPIGQLKKYTVRLATEH